MLRLRSLAACALALVTLVASAQTVTPRGEDGTFDVAAWNIEHFGNPSLGPSDNLQFSNVEAIISGAEIDLWAVQEIGSQAQWSNLLTSLQAEGYAGRLGPETPGSFQLRLGFIYDPRVISVIGTRTILPGNDFGGRQPFELQARVTSNGQSRTVRFISLHAKAGTGADDYQDRRDGAVALKEYMDDRIARGESVVLLGDYNDFLTRSTRTSESESPYAAFLDDANYIAATLEIERNRIPTLCSSNACSSGSTRDHIVFTSTLSAEYIPTSGDRYGEVLTDIQGFVSTTSDHVPVIARFGFAPVSNEPEAASGVALLAPAPHPVRGDLRVRFRLDVPGEAEVEVYDVLGRLMATASGSYAAGEHAIPVGADLRPGAYVVRLAAAGRVVSRTIIRAE